MKASKTCRKLLNDYGGATRVEMFWIYKDAATVVCEHQVRQKNVFGTHVKWEEVIRAGSWNLLRWNSFFEFFPSCVLTNECTYFYVSRGLCKSKIQICCRIFCIYNTVIIGFY